MSLTDIQYIKHALEILMIQGNNQQEITHWSYFVDTRGYRGDVVETPYVALWSDRLKHPVVRVYTDNGRFKYLPDEIKNWCQANQPGQVCDTMVQAQHGGQLHECSAKFLILMFRYSPESAPQFKAVVSVYGNKQQPQAQPAPPQPAPSPQPQSRVQARPSQPAQAQKPPNGAKSADFWLLEAQNAKDPLIFDTAVMHLSPFFPDATAVEGFRLALFPTVGMKNQFDPGFAKQTAFALLEYAKTRIDLEAENPSIKPRSAHETAKAKAYDKFREVVGAKSVPAHLLKKG